jgi:multiple sugar transport system permease protein
MAEAKAAPIRPDSAVEVAPVGDRGRVWRRRIAYAVLIAYALLMFVPAAWMIVTSFKTMPDSVRMTFIPDPITVEGWEFAFTRISPAVPRAFLNSAIIAGAVTLTNVTLGSMAGYAFARLRFPLREPLFLLVLATMMIPDQLRLVPIYQIMRTFGLTVGPAQYGAVILVLAIAAVSVFLLRQYFLSLPRDLEEAAKIDGAGFFTTFARVMLPLATPAIAAVSILQFQGAWNGFFWPLVLIATREQWTLPLALTIFRTEFSTNWPALMAMSFVTMLPIVFIFIFFQRYFVEGIAAAGVKG